MKKNDHLPTFRKKKQRKKLLRGLIYFSPILALFCLVTAIYTASYYEKNRQQQPSPGTVIQAGPKPHSSELLESRSERQETQAEVSSESAREEENVQAEMEESPQALAVDDNTDIYITPRMNYTLEIYDARTDQMTVQEQTIPHAMYGLNRIELEQYLTELARTENEGLVDIMYTYEVRQFSWSAFVVRQTIRESVPEYAVFLIAEQGYLTAYTGDRKQVYEHTQIPLEDFPLEQQAMLTKGIYMKTLADYYDFLETYSS